MRRSLVLVPLVAVSVVLFALAATADTLQKAFMFAVLGALAPTLGIGAATLARMWAWRRMGQELGLRPLEHGAFPDFAGKVDGRRLLVGRRADIYAPGRRETTVIRYEGSPEIRLPGLVVKARTVQQLLAPLRRAP